MNCYQDDQMSHATRKLWLLAVMGAIWLLLAACGRSAQPTATPMPTATPPPPATATPLPTPLPPTAVPPTATPAPVPLTWALAPGLPAPYAQAIVTALAQGIPVTADGGARSLQRVEQAEGAGVLIGFAPLASAQNPIAVRFYAVVVPFATVTDDVTLADLQARWQGTGAGPLYATSAAAADLIPVLGARASSDVVEPDQLLARLAAEPNALGILPFDQLDPGFKVLTVDGINLLSNQFEPVRYPLAVAVTVEGPDVGLLLPQLSNAIQPATNRDAGRLTTFIMTGVTAMSRGTAEKMEEKGYTYPAAIISATLKAADITHVSNEVPFVKGCAVNNTYMNLTLCSDYPYWDALAAIGTDIVGLSGNHVNDFGRDGARESLQFYRDRKIPIYGSGLNIKEACAPLLWEDHGNKFAFLAALAFEPISARATETEPGACYFYDHKDEILASIKDLSQKVDVVAVELQYLETYDPFPTDQQVVEFRELRAAGAEIVSGVQSHVPQAMEAYGARDPGGSGVIVYGLGNLFFDQMWSWEVRTELYARHSIYQGRLLSVEILTAVLEDYAQPRWATPQERADLLKRIFDAAPPQVRSEK